MSWLKEQLNKRNMTQKEFALRCNLSQTAISCYVNEKYIPKLNPEKEINDFSLMLYFTFEK